MLEEKICLDISETVNAWFKQARRRFADPDPSVNAVQNISNNILSNISDVLTCAWFKQARRFADPDPSVNAVQNISNNMLSNISDVLTFRGLLSQGKLANENVKQLGCLTGDKLDTASRAVDLDLAVRDPENGCVLKPQNQLPSIAIAEQEELSALMSKDSQPQHLYAILNVLDVRLSTQLLSPNVTSNLKLKFYVRKPSDGEMTEQFSLSWDRTSEDQSRWQPDKSAVFDLSAFHWGTKLPNADLICVADRIEISTSESSPFPSSVKRRIREITCTGAFKRGHEQSGIRRHGSGLTLSQQRSGLRRSVGLNLSLNDMDSCHTLTFNDQHSLQTLLQVDVKLALTTNRPHFFTTLKTTITPIYVEPFGHLNPRINSGRVSKFHVTFFDGFLTDLKTRSYQVLEVYLRNDDCSEEAQKLPLLHVPGREGTERTDWKTQNIEMDCEVDLMDPNRERSYHLFILLRSFRMDLDKKLEQQRFFAFMPLIWKTGQDEEKEGGEGCNHKSSLVIADDEQLSIKLAIYKFSPSNQSKNQNKEDQIPNNSSSSDMPIPNSYLHLDWKSRYNSLMGNEGERRSYVQRIKIPRPLSMFGSEEQLNTSETTPEKEIKLFSHSFINIKLDVFSCQLLTVEKRAKFFALQLPLDQTLIRFLYPYLDYVFERIANNNNDQEVWQCLFKTLSYVIEQQNLALVLKYIETRFCSPNLFIPMAEAQSRSLDDRSIDYREIIVVCIKFALTSCQQYLRLCSARHQTLSVQSVSSFSEKMNEIVLKMIKIAVEQEKHLLGCIPEVVELVRAYFGNGSQLYRAIRDNILLINSSEINSNTMLRFCLVLTKNNLSNEDGQRILLPEILKKCCLILEKFSLRDKTADLTIFLELNVALQVIDEAVNAVARNNLGSSNYALLPVLRYSLRIACLPVLPNNRQSKIGTRSVRLIAMSIALSCGKLLSFDAIQKYFCAESTGHQLEIVDFFNECLFSLEKIFFLQQKNSSEIAMASYIYMQNSIVATNILEQFGYFIRKKFEQFPELFLHQFLRTCVAFVLQPTLQVEHLQSENFQLERFAKRLGDLRPRGSEILRETFRTFWDNLSTPYKLFCLEVLFQFDASLVEMALSKQRKVRTSACLMLKDIIVTLVQLSNDCTAMFLQSIDHFARKMPRRTQEFCHDFVNAFYQSNQSGVSLLEIVKNQCILLEDYNAAKFHSPFAELTCLRRLSIFYKKNNSLTPLYAAYLETLYSRHLEREKFVEAASVLRELSCVLSWTGEPLPDFLKNCRLVEHTDTQRSLKSGLLNKAAKLFEENGLVEKAIEIFHEIGTAHFKCTFDYEELAKTYVILAEKTRKIVIPEFLPRRPKFFWINFSACPAILPCLANNSFIFRAPSHQQIADVANLFKSWFPGVIVRHEVPSGDADTKPSATIYILSVQPNSYESVSKKFPLGVPERIVSYYRDNDVMRFVYICNLHLNLRSAIELQGFNPLPGALEWVDVENVRRREIGPVEMAVYDVTKKNAELCAALDTYLFTRDDTENKQFDLQRGVSGTIRADVNGGIGLYTSYFKNNSNRQLDEQNKAEAAALKQLHQAILNHHWLISKGKKYLKDVIKNAPEMSAWYQDLETRYPAYNNEIHQIQNWPNSGPEKR